MESDRYTFVVHVADGTAMVLVIDLLVVAEGETIDRTSMVNSP